MQKMFSNYNTTRHPYAVIVYLFCFKLLLHRSSSMLLFFTLVYSVKQQKKRKILDLQAIIGNFINADNI